MHSTNNLTYGTLLHPMLALGCLSHLVLSISVMTASRQLVVQLEPGGDVVSVHSTIDVTSSARPKRCSCA